MHSLKLNMIMFRIKYISLKHFKLAKPFLLLKVNYSLSIKCTFSDIGKPITIVKQAKCLLTANIRNLLSMIFTKDKILFNKSECSLHKLAYFLLYLNYENIRDFLIIIKI